MNTTSRVTPLCFDEVMKHSDHHHPAQAGSLSGVGVGMPAAPEAHGPAEPDRVGEALDLLLVAITERADGLTDELTQAAKVSDRLELHLADLVARAEARGLPGRDGAKATRDWVAHRTARAKVAAGGLVAVARHCSDLHDTIAAVRAGRLGMTAAVAAARVANRTPKADHAELDRQVATSRALGWEAEVSGWVWRWAAANDPDQLAQDAALDRALRSVHLQDRIDGGIHLTADLDVESAIAVRQLLLDATPVDAGDERTASQRRADALTDAARRTRTAPAATTTVSAAPAEITINIDLDRLTAALGPGEVLDHHGALLPADVIRRFACDARIIPAVLDTDGTVLDLGRARRLPSGSQRRALVLRDRHCRYPGCTTRHQWTDVHHVQHWADGGATDLSNLLLLCRHHHTRVHDLALDLTLTAKGGLVVRRPDGAWIGATAAPPRT